MIIFHTTLCAERQLAMGGTNLMDSIITVPVSMVLISVGCPSRIKHMAGDVTSGAMLLGIVNLVLVSQIVLVPIVEVVLLHSLAAIFTASLALTRLQPSSGTPPTHSGTAKAVTLVVGAVTTLVCRGFGRPCLRKLLQILMFACASQVGLAKTKLALNNLNFMCTSHTTNFSFL